MFFNRIGTDASLARKLSKSSRTDKTSRPAENFGTKASDGENIFRKRAVAVALAVQFALPAGMISRLSAVRAADPSPGSGDPAKAAASSKTPASFEDLFGVKPYALPRLSAHGAAADGFKAGMGLLQAGEYEKAVTALQGISETGLSDADSNLIDTMIVKTRKAVRERAAARTELSNGDLAMSSGSYATAALHYRRAASNTFADVQTQKTAAQQLTNAGGSLHTAPAVMQPIQADVSPVTPAFAAPAPRTPAAVPAGMLLAQATAPTPPAPADTSPATGPGAMPVTPPAPVNPPAPVTPAAGGDDSAAGQALDAALRAKAIQQQKNAYDASKLVEKARNEDAAGQLTDAMADYQAAVKIDPTSEQARAGLIDVEAKLGVGNSRPGNGSGNDIPLRIQAITYHFNSAINAANTDIDAGKNDATKFGDAQKQIEAARVAAAHDPALFTQAQLNDFNTIIKQTQLRLDTEKASADSAALEKSQDAALKNENIRKQQFERDRQRTVTNLIQDARNYVEEGKYIEAIAVIDNIQKVDPTNEYANSVRQFVQDKADTQRQRKYQEQIDQNMTQQLNDAVERKIPYDDIVAYSPDWPTISKMRDAEVKEDQGQNEDDAQLQATLDRHLPELRFNANGLSDVIDFLRDVTGANIYVDWPALERASIARDAPVTAKLRDIKFSKALELIFKSVEGESEDQKLGYTLNEGVITISTKKELNKNTVTRRYDINDLLFVAPDYNNAPDLSLQSASQGQTGGGGGGGGGGGQSNQLFNNTQSQGQNAGQAGQDRANRVDEIKKYITDNVDPTTWKDNGGDVGSISSSPLRAILLITQTPEAQRKIQSVLDSLRASQALQVSIETRFLVVQRNYLEDIGVNADFEFNPLQNPANARSGYNSSRFTPVSISQSAVTDNTTFRDANGNVVSNNAQGSRTLDWISNVGNAAVPGSIAADPADYPNPLVVSGSYVDNLTVTFLIRAVQANQNTTSLTAPRLTLFSGQRAVLIVQTQQAYVSNLTPVVAPGVGLFDPQVSTTTATGVVLSVQATVSPDRKYVFLDLQPQLARLRALVPFSISAVIQPVNNILGGGTPQIVTGTLQLPTIDLTVVRTSVSVPDGATLLLGGQTLAAETTREQGVPVLSKIPFLKRLFTNRATSQDEQILLILVKPTILIQREQEQKQFPQLSAKLPS